MAETLGTFEQAVLLAIVRLKEDAYGRAILKEVQDRLEREIVAGAVHATLERLETRGLIASRLGPGTPIRDGRSGASIVSSRAASRQSTTRDRQLRTSGTASSGR